MITYQSTTLENYVESIYNHIDIRHPENINLSTIAEILKIPTYFLPLNSQVVTFNGLRINIDSRLSPPEQWEDFGHELCHVLRQYGSQLNMQTDFLTYQEEKADNFALHFCVPTFMLEELELPLQRSLVIGFIAETFNVTPLFAKKRLERYEQQLLGSKYSAQLQAQFEAEQEFKRQIGCDYVHEDSHNTYLINRNNGIVGIINKRSDY
ncbi:ImmA/IrrE family metallo-endopeptidase [Bacillus sp. FJAT-45350]|uniref:ImmA/IrrE family metallo-endopeptidase n=1 Tax=Bacillus sp. FJAT-45350 TaxID=2011014 RepID=UPI000BB9A897|nr:ImmA/IrrE family metallo-endopeptidase [Bacillus sp. FJAT-45350]